MSRGDNLALQVLYNVEHRSSKKWLNPHVVAEYNNLTASHPGFLEATTVNPLIDTHLHVDGYFGVYELIDPTTSSRFYIGCTNSPFHRYRQHLRGEFPVTRSKVFELAKHGLRVGMQILGSIDSREEALTLEAKFIYQSRFAGIRLLNSQVPNLCSKRASTDWLTAEQLAAIVEALDIPAYRARLALKRNGFPSIHEAMSCLKEDERFIGNVARRFGISRRLADEVRQAELDRPLIEALLELRSAKEVARRFGWSSWSVRRLAKREGISVVDELKPRGRLDTDQVSEILRLFEENPNSAEVARQTGISQSTVWTIAKKHNLI